MIGRVESPGVYVDDELIRQFLLGPAFFRAALQRSGRFITFRGVECRYMMRLG